MKNKILITIKLVIITFLFLQCEKDTNSTDSNLKKVSGYIYCKGTEAAGVIVDIDGMDNLKSLTDENGYFEIPDVSKGNHKLNIFREVSLKSANSDSTSFSQNSYDIAVYEDILLSELELPVPINLYSVVQLDENQIQVKWTQTYASDFREYKIFRHQTTGLDENTGTLVHVATNIGDTTFVDKDFQPNQAYYYRIYVMNDFGKLGGSNIVGLVSDNINFIVSGNFETPDYGNNFFPYWEYFLSAGPNPFSIDSLNTFDGKYCLKIEIKPENNFDNMLKFKILPENFQTGVRYKLSFYYKHTAFAHNQQNFGYFFSGNTTISGSYFVTGPTDEVDWQKKEIDFIVPDDNTVNEYLLWFNFMNMMSDTSYTVWLDNVEMKQH